MIAPADNTPLPTAQDVEAIAAALTAGTLQAEQAAAQLLHISGSEPHPRVKAAVLRSVGHLVAGSDADRAVAVLRESFRLFPAVDVGKRLADLAVNDAVFQRLFRFGHLVDATAILATDGPAQTETLLEAARGHVGQGHGRAALAVLDRLLAGKPDLAEAKELREVAQAQVADREASLAGQREALANCQPSERADSLVAYAELLLAGDEPLAEAAQALSQAVDAGADLTLVAPLWVEVARAQGDDGELTRALSCSLAAGDALPTRLQHADELVNIASVDRVSPQAALVALQVILDAAPEDTAIAARLDAVQRMLSPAPEAQLEEMRQRTVRDRDRNGETVASLALAFVAQRNGDWAGAERHYRRVRTLAPQDTEALDFFENWYRRTDDHKRLLVALSQRLGSSEGRETVRIALEMARLCEGPLEAPDRAIEAYQRVLTAQPDHEGALTALHRLNEQLQHWPEVREVLERKARVQVARAAIDPRTRDVAVATLGDLLAICTNPERGGEPAAAVAVARQIVDLAPDHPQAVEIVCANLRDHSRYGELATILRRAAVAATGERKAAFFLRLGDVLADALGQPAGAMDAWREALACQPNLAEAQAKLRQAARASGDANAVLASLLDEIAENIGAHAIDLDTALPERTQATQGTQAALIGQLTDAAKLAEARGDGRRLAGRLHALALTAAATQAALTADSAALAGAVRCWSTAEDAGNLLNLADRLLATQPDRGGQLHLMRIKADTQLNFAADLAGAAATAEAILAIAPDDAAAREIFADAASALGDMAALRRACGAGAEGAEAFALRALEAANSGQGVARLHWWRAAATAFADELGDSERAAVVLTDAVQAALSDADLPADENGATLKRQLCELLSTHAHLAGLRGAERLALEAQLELTEGAAQRDIRMALCDLMAATGEIQDAAAVATGLAEEAIGNGDGATLLAAAARLGGWAGNSGADGAGDPAAWPALTDLLALAAEDAAIRQTAGRQLFDWCLAQAEQLAAGEQGPQTVAKLAQIAQTAGQGQLAAEQQLRALALLEPALVECGQWAEAADAAEGQAALLQGAAACGALVRAAELAHEKLGNGERAEALYRRALAADADDAAAWTGLVGAVRAGGDATALALLLDDVLASAALGRDSRALFALERTELAATLGETDPLGSSWSVVQALAQVDGLTETEETLLAIAAGQLDVPDLGSTVAERLLPVYAKHGRRDDELRCRELIALHAPRHSDARVSGLIAVADAVSDEAPRQAFEALFHAMADAPERPDLLERLVGLADRVGAHDRLQRLLRGMAGLDQTGEFTALAADHRSVALRRLGELADARHDSAAALEAYEAWHAAEPTSADALAGLERARAASGDMLGAMQAAADQTTLGDDNARASAWLRRLALAEQTGAADSAELLALAKQAVTALPQQVDLWRNWLDLARQSGSAATLAEALTAALGNPHAGLADRRTALRELALALTASGPDRAAEAVARWLELLEDDPTDDAAISAAMAALATIAGADRSQLAALIDRLEPIADARGESDRVASLLEMRAELAQDRGEQALIWRKVAALRESALGDLPGSVAALCQAAKLTDELADVMADLCSAVQTAVSSGMLMADAAVAVDGSAAGRADPAERLALRRAALEWFGADAPLEAARPLLQGILQDDPDDAVAMARLDALAAASGDAQARMGLLALRISRATGDDACALWLEKAQIAADAGLADQAKAAFAEAAKSTSAEMRTAAHAGWADLCESTDDLAGAAAAVQALLADTADADDHMAQTLRAAGLWQAAGDGAAAQAILASALAARPDCVPLHTALEAALTEAGDLPALVRHLDGAWDRLDGIDDSDKNGLAERWLAALTAVGTDAAGQTAAAIRLIEAGLAVASSEAALRQIAEADDGAADLPAWRQAAWLALAGLAESRGEAESELTARLQLASQSGDRAVVLANRRRAAAVLQAMGEDDAALAQWLEILQLGHADPALAWTDADAAQALQLGDRLGRSSEVSEFVQLSCSELTDTARKAALLLLLAERAGQAGDFEAQWALAQQLLAEQPDHAAALQLRGAALLQWPDAPLAAKIAHAEAMAQRPADDADKAEQLLALALLQFEDSGSIDAACAALVRLAEIGEQPAAQAFATAIAKSESLPGVAMRATVAACAEKAAAILPDAATWLEADARERGDLAGLDGLIAARAERSQPSDADGAVAALLELAALRSEERGDAKAAAEALDRARALAPANEGVLRLRLQLAEDASDHAAAADLCGALAGAAAPDEAAVLWMRSAEAWLAAGQTQFAIDACHTALVVDEHSVDAQELLGRLTAETGDVAGAVKQLQGAAQKLSASSAPAAARLWLQAAGLAQKADQPTQWAQCLAGALADAGQAQAVKTQADPQKLQGAWLAAAVATLAPAYHKAGMRAEAMALRQQLADSATGAEKLAARRGLAQQAADDGDADAAIGLLFDVAAEPDLPGDDLAAVIGEAQAIAETSGRVADWVDRVAELVGADRVPAEHLVAIVAGAAQAANDAGHADRGADLWEQVWEQRPDDSDARDGTLALRRLANEPARLAAALERAMLFADNQEKPALRLELAALKFDELGRPREAVRLVQDVLQAEPTNAEAIALAERLAANPVTGEEVLGFLERHFRASKDWQGLERTLQRRMDNAKTPAAKAELAQALAQLQAEHLAHAQDALRSLWAAIQADPRLSTLESIEKLARQPDDDELLGRAHALILGTPLRAEDKAAVLQRAAVVDQRRGDLAAAERRLREAMKTAPVAASAFERLDALLDEQGRFAELVDLLVQRAGLVDDAEPKRALLYRAAEMAKALQDNDAAIDVYRRLAALDPNDAESRAAIVELARLGNRDAVVAEALADLAHVTDDPRKAAEMLCEAARLQPADKAGQELCERYYKQAFETDGTCDEAFVWLERHANHNPRQLAHLLQARCDALPKGPSRVLVLRKLAHAHRDVGDGLGACETLALAMREDPHNSAVLDELQKTAESLRQWPAWVEAVEHKLAAETRKEQRPALLAQLARVLLAELDDAVRAQPAVAELQKLAPKDPTTRQVVAMLKSHSGDPVEAAAGLEQVVRETDDPQALLAIHQQLADLYLGPLNNAGKGIRELQKVILLDPRRFDYRRKLCDLYAQRQSHEALAESLKQWLAQLEDVDDKRTLQLARGMEIVGLLRELAEVLVTLGKPQEAAQHLRRAYELGGQDLAVNTQLATLLELTGDVELAATLHDWLANHHANNKALAASHLSKAALIFERCGDLQAARERFKKAMESAPGDDEATLGSARVCLELGEPDRAMRLFDAVARKPAATTSADLRADAQFGMGKCRLARHQRDQARVCFEQALALVPGHKAAGEALHQL